MKKIIIAAVAKNFVIGKDGKMPWHISEELKHFKKTTMNFPLLMGRKTYVSFGAKPLKGRLNCVLTRDENYQSDYDNLKVFNDIDELFNHCGKEGFEKIFIIGGSEIYNSTINHCDEMVLSFLNEDYEGDTYFPEIDENIWNIDNIEKHDRFDVHYYIRRKI
ncbi:MAG: dihydrofolate reductase [Melioribacteraceae bacterium]|nr:MAG: dihydrofolate reductase [Melioribacteraceae bacterium]